jgi:hypothetical protein
MSATACGPKTFNNCLSFERGFWQSKIGRFSVVPKRRVFGTVLHGDTAGFSKKPVDPELHYLT